MAEEAASVIWKLEKQMDRWKKLSRKQLQVGSGIRNQLGDWKRQVLLEVVKKPADSYFPPPHPSRNLEADS